MSLLTRGVERLGRGVLNPIEELGRTMRIMGLGALNIVLPPFRLRLIFQQLEFVGVQSLSIVVLAGVFTGAVFALQSNVAFAMFGAQGLVGSTVALALTKELAPTLTALMVTGRAGSAMAAEIGTMRVTEQVDALEAMAVDPVSYLVAPRIIAGTIMVPMLTMVFDIVGILGAYVVAVKVLHIPEAYFTYRIEYYVDPDDIFEGLIKAAVFGLIMSVVGCTKGYYARGGAQGVGKATTNAVVTASVAILIADYFLTSLMI